MRSIQAETAPGQVTIENPVPYAAIHNDGGDITTHPTVTERMRKYAWHMVYSLAGIKGKGKLPKELPAWDICFCLSREHRRADMLLFPNGAQRDLADKECRSDNGRGKRDHAASASGTFVKG